MKKVILTLCMVALTMGSTILAADKTSNATDSNTTLVKRVNISSFCKAVIKGDLETVKRLIDLGEDVNQKSLGMTPAMFAARYNKVDVLEILIDNGADLNLKSNQGYTAKRYAELSNATDALELIEIAAGS
ncbi:ankyrin repeat domain-containing protein [Maribacter dokdonensis]|uniref:ankyrin repeat domain-containing protein n=1 Tax=Maribacter dokdonensis TaxID=320912 RepID=UPI001C0A606B|nr:ankyrin repeat domain-containing protein [Maribacter dokdonensis]MBU2899505.1 ankyrin repeat domain-containing protein [Maribacter dokdonensis]